VLLAANNDERQLTSSILSRHINRHRPQASLVFRRFIAYDVIVKFRSFLSSAGSLLLLAAFSASGALNGQKPVHLRNATLANESAAVSPVQQPTNGLFLIQFHSAPSLEEREQLRTNGVELLQYVPKDTFIARFSHTGPALVAQLSFVNWIGAYRPESKIHRALIGGANTNRPVAVLLHSRATPAQVLFVRQRILLPRMSEPQRFGTVIRGVIKPSQLIALAQSEAVLWIESSPAMKLNDEVSSKIVAGDGGANQLYTASLGFDGAGVKVAVADSGLDDGISATMHPDLFGRTPTFFFYGTLTDASDEHSHGTHCTGIIAGTGATGETDDNGYLFGLGVAPGVDIITQRIFDGVGSYEAPPSFEKLTRDAKSAGADIGSNSWGDDTQGRYDISAMEFDGLVRDANALAVGDQPYILEFSAGNAGPGEQTIGSPAVGKNVIATGASENDRTDLLIYSDGPETMADFSSRGPCEDGRIKPDLVAPGTWIASAKSSVAPDDNSWAPISDNYLYVGGTSQSGPHVSGAAAVFVQYYRTTHTNITPSPALVKAALINSAVDMDDSFGTTPVPNNDEGWGLLDLTEIIGSTRAFSFLDQTELLTHDLSFTQSLLVASQSEPLKITLTYTDVPGFPGAIPALVNDLDLEVTGPDGRIYCGNQFDADGESVPNAGANDRVNNVEAVHLFEPLPGEYIIRVHARNVVQDARQDTAGIDQDFALVTSGDLPEPGTGLVILDRGHYRAPSTIHITVIDGDLAGNASASALVSSSTETNGEVRVLFAASNTGKFTNSIPTATGAPTSDGSLQITNSDTIEVRYFDASSGSNRSAFAIGDFVPPVITAVDSTNTFGQRIISWQTDEPSTSIVRYDTNTSLTLSVTNLDLTGDHSVVLTGLIVNKWYKYAVISTDEAGNTTTNNNISGTYFSFQALPTATLLLVDSYHEPLFGSPPLSGYTSALNQLGISYDPWDVAALASSPTITNLQPYRAVIWRVPDLLGVWSAAERSAISNYVKGGGGLFVASMEVLSRLDEAGASSFWRNVLHVESYVADDTVSQITGTPGAPVGDGVDSSLDYSVYETIWGDLIQLGILPDANISDTITPSTNAVSILTDTGATVGLRWPKTGVIGPGRVVFFPFPLDAVPTGNTNSDERAHLLRNVIQFLVPGVNGLGSVAFDSPAYTVPSLVTVEVADSDLISLGTITNTFYSTTQSNAVSATLTETPEPGVFRGTITLVAATNPPSAGTLRVKNGDTIGCVYFDASANASVQATAIVDTNAPTITGVSAVPDYVDALISWATSENADSLVQFGESPFLNRTAVDEALAIDHELALTGLRPNRTYYYKVVSRDAAGNASVNDNNGLLYTFTTLVPLVPPWSDNLNTGITNWSVQTEGSSDSRWTLGVPNNGKETSASSPPLAWGSNLDGGSISYAESFLISPAIDLTGGNNATLRFSHSYDFFFTSWDILNGGELLIITNTALSPVSLAAFADDANFGWEEEEINLSPFTGQVVYLVWYYQLFSFETSPRPAWLVDDISLTVSNVAGGTLQISNNLWQARFVMTGPTNFAGKGLSSVISNATPGQYVITYNPVAFYGTPISETKLLSSGSNVVFQGNYTFTDVNSNTIADGWETTYFGGVSSNRTALTDTDKDSMTDYAEFIAGTDPNNPLPSFRITASRLTNGTVRLEWPAAPGHSYRVHTSTNAITWSPLGGWTPATGVTNSQIILPLVNGRANLFRVEAQPGNLPATFRVRATLLAGNTVRLDWSSAADRGYRVLSTTDGNSWSPFSGWIHAVSANTSFILPPRTNGTPRLFRMEVRP